MSCQNTNCNPGCGCNGCCPPVPPPTPPTPPICIGTPCEESYDGACVLYTGDNLDCIGIKTNDTINTIIQTLAARICACCVNVTLSITKTASTLTPIVENNITFTIVINNDSSHAATNVIVTDILQPGFSFISYTVTNGTWTDPTWTIGTMEAYQVCTLTLTVKVNCLGSYDNLASVISDQTSIVESSIIVIPEVLCTSCCSDPLEYFLSYAWYIGNSIPPVK
jgi:uncharacterized repeat protein (TIGR01451 family)